MSVTPISTYAVLVSIPLFCDIIAKSLVEGFPTSLQFALSPVQFKSAVSGVGALLGEFTLVPLSFLALVGNRFTSGTSASVFSALVLLCSFPLPICVSSPCLAWPCSLLGGGSGAITALNSTQIITHNPRIVFSFIMRQMFWRTTKKKAQLHQNYPIFAHAQITSASRERQVTSKWHNVNCRGRHYHQFRAVPSNFMISGGWSSIPEIPQCFEQPQWWVTGTNHPEVLRTENSLLGDLRRLHHVETWAKTNHLQAWGQKPSVHQFHIDDRDKFWIFHVIRWFEEVALLKGTQSKLSDRNRATETMHPQASSSESIYSSFMMKDEFQF